MNLRTGTGPGSAPGFTLIETAISLTVFVILITSLLSLSIETSNFVGLTDADTVVELEATRAWSRLGDMLRKSGRVDDASGAFPRVTGGGAGLQFRLLSDLDGNGHPFREDDGEPEWDPRVFEVRADEGGNLRVWESGEPIHHLGRYIGSVEFRTVDEDVTLRLREIAVSFEARKPSGKGFDLVRAVSGSVHMRN